jgi:RecA-family ATPase
MGGLPDGMLIHTPGKFKLNLWEEDGYQKRRETGNRERVSGLIQALRAQAASLVIFDPLRHFHSLNELNVDHVAHLFEVFRAIGRAVPCGVMIVHHHRKIARSQVEYEGAEDMSGSGALFGEADSILSIYRKVRSSDDTRRFKMVFDHRHAETPEPMELFRLGGENAMLWTAEPWSDTPSGSVDESLDRILAVLEKDRMAGWKAAAIEKETKLKKSSVYGKLKMLVRDGKVRKDGNVYYIVDE